MDPKSKQKETATASRRYAALDIGSNTVRLLVAEVDGDQLQALADRSEFVRLGLGVDTEGAIRPDREEAGMAAIEHLVAFARNAAVEDIVAFATSAIRDAANGRAFMERVHRAFGIDVQILSGDREAKLTYLGATHGVSRDGGLIVVDLGGGSAEIIAADESGMQWGTSLQMGSGRLSERYIRHDPPTPHELLELDEFVKSQLRTLHDTHVRHCLYTGGTASHIGILLRRDDFPITIVQQDLRDIVYLLCTTSASEVVQRFGVKPERATVLPAGVEALLCIAGFYDVDHITLIRQGIREGAIWDAVTNPQRAHNDRGTVL